MGSKPYQIQVLNMIYFDGVNRGHVNRYLMCLNYTSLSVEH